MTKELLEIVGDFYEAAYQPSHWETAINNLCKLLGAKSAGLFMHDYQSNTRSLIASYGLPKMTEISYRFGLGKYDSAFEIMARQTPGSARIIMEKEEAINKHPLYYRFLLKPNNIGYISGINIYRDDEWYIGLGVHRSLQAENFTDDDINLLNLLYPHLKRAIRIQREFHRLKSRQQSLEATLSRLMLGVIVLDTNGKVGYCNPVATAIMQQHPALQIVQNRPRAYHAGENEQLRSILESLLVSDTRDIHACNKALGLHHPDRETPLTVMLAPLSNASASNTMGTGDGITLYLSDQDSSFNLPYDALCSIYQLTPAEAKLAVGLANGLSLQQYAEQNNSSVTTVRSQLKSVFSKMEVNKQQDVVRILLSGALSIH